jgi:hypothetical protein
MNRYKIDAMFLYPCGRHGKDLIIGSSEIIEAENLDEVEQRTSILSGTPFEASWNKWKETHEDNSKKIYSGVNDPGVAIVIIKKEIEEDWAKIRQIFEIEVAIGQSKKKYVHRKPEMKSTFSFYLHNDNLTGIGRSITIHKEN